MQRAFEGRHVVVSGATGALGTAVVEALAEAGAVVHAPAFEDEATLREREWKHLDAENVQVKYAVRLDDDDAVGAYYAALPGVWASVHIAGGFAMAPVLETSLAEVRRMFEMNLVTAFSCSREAVRRMREGGEGGRIVNVAAKPALVPTGGMSAYAIAKSAVAALTLGLAEELADERIFVNAVVPSIIDTPANRAAMPDTDPTPWPKVQEVADAIVGLAAPGKAVVRGALVPVYGAT